ncbi:cytochrome P450 [Streptosporangium sp. NPDC023825]|uniref:cytochrome P450 family protein n=1 Tax=Streptosporangium sp. NPDC023825 TaxID=3154909 RepID=UPI00342492F2
MTAAGQDVSDIPEVPGVPEIHLTDAEVLRDPFAAYGRAREISPLARLVAPGFGPMLALTRHEDVRAMLSDPRFEINAASFMRPDVPEDCLPYMRTMSEMDGPEHLRLRRLVSPAFSARRAAEFRPRIEPIVDALLDGLPGVAEQAEHGVVDLLGHFARPLPMDVICELVGIPAADRPRWREYGATVVGGGGQRFAEAIPGIMEGARAAVARRRAEPGDDLLSDLIRAQADDGDRLSDTELVTMVWHLVLAGQTPTNLIANAVEVLLTHPGHLAALREDAGLMPRAVEELTRWCGPTLLSIPRYAREDVELHGTLVREGEPVTAAIAAANRDPRAFADPDLLDLGRATATAGHLGFAHGPHFCLGASLARVQTEVALTALLSRFPGLALAPENAGRAPDPGTWRLASLLVTL